PPLAFVEEKFPCQKLSHSPLPSYRRCSPCKATDSSSALRRQRHCRVPALGRDTPGYLVGRASELQLAYCHHCRPSRLAQSKLRCGQSPFLANRPSPVRSVLPRAYTVGAEAAEPTH